MANFESDLGVLIATANPAIWIRLNESTPPAVEMHRGDELATWGAPTFDNTISVGVTFDGVDDALVLDAETVEGIPQTLVNSSGEFTVSLLMRADYVASEGVTTVARYGFNGVELTTYRFPGVDNTGYLTFKYYDWDSNSHTVESYGAYFDPAQYVHVAATYDGSDLKLYVEGVEVKSEPVGFYPPSLPIGPGNGLGLATNGPFGGSYWKGSISEFAIFDRALTALEISDHAVADRSAVNDTDVSTILLDWGEPPLPDASSFHIALNPPPVSPGNQFDFFTSREAAVNLRVIEEPKVDELYFWAMQVNWFSNALEPVGGAHVGLQFHPDFINSNKHAVNWGGYNDSGDILSGTESALPSDTDNDNTRNFDWQVGKSYRLRVFSIGDYYWRATVNGVVIRDLYVPGGDILGDVILWSEVFADCDDPSVLVEWSYPTITDAVKTFPMESGVLSYQDPGCDNTNTYEDSGRVYQQTNTTRVNITGQTVNFDPSTPLDAGEASATINVGGADFSQFTQDAQALGTYTDNTGREAGIRIDLTGFLEVDVEPLDDESIFTMMRRVSPIMPTSISLNSRGVPQ